MAALAELELLEREPEVAALRPVLEAAHEGAGRLVVVEGPPGIGKTRLLAATRSLAAGAGLETLWGRGGEFEREFPYGVARQLFEPLLDKLGPGERDELLAGAAALAAPLFDAGREAPDAGDRRGPSLERVSQARHRVANAARRGALLEEAWIARLARRVSRRRGRRLAACDGPPPDATLLLR